MKIFGSLLLLLGLVTAVHAQPHTTVGPMTARLDPSGRLTVTSDHWSTDLLVTAKIDGHIYTNNPSPNGVIRLTSPVLGQLRDTVEVMWTTADSIDIYLKCSPYDSDLMVEVNFDNRSSSEHICGAQVLHHYAVDGATAPFLGTDRDYSDIARAIPAPGDPRPPRMMIIAQRNASLDPYEPGFTAASLFSASRLNLVQAPDALYFSVWASLATVPFGPPANLPVGCDGGVLLVWSPRSIAPSHVTTIARWLMLPGVDVCSSSDAVIFSASVPAYPTSLHQFWVGEIAYAVNQRGLTNARLTITLDNPMSLASPNFGSVNHDSVGTMSRGDCRMAAWTVTSPTSGTASPLTHLSVEADNITPFYHGGCEFAYAPATSQPYSDTQSPTVVSEKASGGLGGRPCNAKSYVVTVYDAMSGIAEATIKGTNFDLSSTPFIPGSDSGFFMVFVVDSLSDGHAQVSYNDRFGNSVGRTYTYCTVADTAAPLIQMQSYTDSARVLILENRAWDRGINFFSLASATNAQIDSETLHQSIDSLSFVIRRTDLTQYASYCLSATDRAGNTSEVSCWSSSTNAVAVERTPFDISVRPNPAYSSVTVTTGEPSVVELYDLLGARVLSVDCANSINLDIHTLTEGTYVLRISTQGQVQSRLLAIRK